MQFTKPQKIILGAVGVIILFFILVFAGILPGLRQNIGPSVKLQVWGVGDDYQVWQGITNSYSQAHTNVTVQYTSLAPADYESKLINALAAGNGPDVFMFGNSWLDKHGDKIVPAPASVINLATFQNLFPQVAVQDLVKGGSVYAMPLSVDTLALLYNKDMFDQKGIAIPPSTWKQFQSLVLKTRSVSGGRITVAGSAIGGTTASVTNGTDLLNLLFMQTGTSMLSADGTQATFASQTGASALTFYTGFGTPGNPYYTWNDAQGSDLSSFANKRSAMIFAYASQIPVIEAANPFLNIGVQPMPQFDVNNAVNYAKYWSLAVSAKSANQAAAWDFVNYVTTDPTITQNYAAASKRPPALSTLVAQYESDPVLGPYARQALTARSWSQPDPDAVSSIFNDMIQSELKGTLTTNQVLSAAQNSVDALITPSSGQ